MAHILLLEPDRLLAETYRRSFIEAGHTVTPCASAQAAIMAADQQKPDVVVIEIQLVGHSGIEFLYEFRSYVDWNAIPVVIHSQVPATEFNDNWRQLGTRLGVSQYLYKPHTNLSKLQQVVNSHLLLVA